MKNESGVTLTSLVVYCIIMLILVTALIVIRNNIESNIKEINELESSITEINKLSMYMIKETKNGTNRIRKVSNNAVEFTDGNQYVYADAGIYKVSLDGKRIRICENIMECQFGYDMQNGYDIVTVTLKLGKDKEIINKTMKYVITGVSV